MGQLMGIVGPLLLLGGAIYVFSKRCELLGMCGETPADSGVIPDASATTNPIDDQVAAGAAANPGMSQSRGCCECKMVGDRVKCQKNGDGNWYNPPAGEGGSNDQDIGLSLNECYKTCGSSSSNSTNGAGASAGVRAGASIPKKPRLQASGSVSAGAGAGGNKKSSSSSKKPSSGSGLTGGAGVKAGASFYSGRSYFVDPNYVRPFNLFHRIAN